MLSSTKGIQRGNYFYAINITPEGLVHKEIFIVDQIQKNCLLDKDENILFFKHFEPILLNIDWLKKFGFIEKAGQYNFIGTAPPFHLVECKTWKKESTPVYVKCKGGGINFSKFIKYVHEFQNLMYIHLEELNLFNH